LCLPGSGAERGDPGLQESSEEDGRVLAGEDEVEDTERGEEVNHEASDDGHHVHAQLLRGHRQVGQLHYLTGYQAHYAERRIPDDTHHITCHSLAHLGPVFPQKIIISR